MKRFLFVFLLLSFSAFGDIPGVQTLPPQGPNGDPCVTSGVAKQSVSVNISTATTTLLAAAPANALGVNYVCGFALSTTGATTATTFQFEYGTGATCTTPTVLTGAMGANATATAVATVDPVGGAIMSGAAGAAICMVSAGTTISITGVVTFVTRNP